MIQWVFQKDQESHSLVTDTSSQTIWALQWNASLCDTKNAVGFSYGGELVHTWGILIAYMFNRLKIITKKEKNKNKQVQVVLSRRGTCVAEAGINFFQILFEYFKCVMLSTMEPFWHYQGLCYLLRLGGPSLSLIWNAKNSRNNGGSATLYRVTLTTGAKVLLSNSKITSLPSMFQLINNCD